MYVYKMTLCDDFVHKNLPEERVAAAEAKVC